MFPTILFVSYAQSVQARAQSIPEHSEANAEAASMLNLGRVKYKNAIQSSRIVKVRLL